MICRGFCDGPHGVLGDEVDSILDYEELKPDMYLNLLLERGLFTRQLTRVPGRGARIWDYKIQFMIIEEFSNSYFFLVAYSGKTGRRGI